MGLCVPLTYKSQWSTIGGTSQYFAKTESKEFPVSDLYLAHEMTWDRRRTNESLSNSAIVIEKFEAQG